MSEVKKLSLAVGGIYTECSTFNPVPAEWHNFKIVSSEEMRGSDRYTFLSTQFPPSTEVHYLSHARAIPGGRLSKQCHAKLHADLITQLRTAQAKSGGLDGVLLDLHGAVYVDGMEDYEGRLAEEVRGIVGEKCFITCSLDLHGAVSEALTKHCDAITAFRTAPHIDQYETRERACRIMAESLLHRNGQKPFLSRVRVPALFSGEQTSTVDNPAASRLWGSIANACTGDIREIAVLVGYIWANEPRSHATVVATGWDKASVDRAACQFAQAYWDSRKEFVFGVPAGTVTECVAMAAKCADRPVFLSDAGDNPTAGGVGDVPLALQELVESRARNAVYASIWDHDSVMAMRSAGVGRRVTLELGGRRDIVTSVPYEVTGRVINITEGDPVGGCQGVLDIEGRVRAIVTERRKPFHRLSDFTQLGIEVSDCDIVMVKIGYLVPELAEAAKSAYLCLTPGSVNPDVLSQPDEAYNRLVRPMYPFDRDSVDGLKDWRAQIG